MSKGNEDISIKYISYITQQLKQQISD